MVERTNGRLNFKGDIRAGAEARVYDTAHGPMRPLTISYDPETDLTTIELEAI